MKHCPRTSLRALRGVAAFTILLLFAPAALRAQSAEATDDAVAKAHAKIRPFLEDLTSKQTTPERAFEDLLLGSPLAGRKQAIEQLVARSKELESRYGTFRAAERIDAKRIGTDVLLLRYLYKCDNFPVVWYFTLYRDQRPGMPAESRNWSIIAVRFDTEIELLGL